MFYTYCITNKINGKQYVGKTSDITRRLYHYIWLAKRGSEQHIHRAIRKYGFNNFSFGIIKICKYEKIAFEYEKVYIKELNTFGSNGYNETFGGEGFSSGEFHPWKNGLSQKHIESIRKGSIKAKKIMCLNTGKTYSSIRSCAREMGLFHQNIVRMLKGRCSQVKGYKFAYVKEIE